ncbi:similar to Saccharomyces cerevisiae YDR266C Protein of unknown function that may interact with ribosomes [Maudiozyma barnettii]|uniref:RING-type E3 ubiquitin transferase n=1 Tax=Maudiozyma barnettii TaxID=61262 RepID=A0A8H2ZLN6_9SACH|nr:E3 ubiquitin-protein ligase HEL2 [Kazachstania barnettii]CAB4256297.1 similar to Saccharomyces cerevisiae YDR266C Protein of unknown function that may interact with ribosomes [Kazachstania barnettii]CAD1784906.1 similar to Saccharomyces cerevisiae YDR266C Protein of unknown function that may interact with ribosomes [Kazachstania barnettii]
MSEPTKTTASKGKRNFRRTQGPQTGSNKSKHNQSNGHHHGNDEDSEDDDDDYCLICAEKLEYVSLTPCNHKTCNKCGFKQLALFEKKNCMICRTELSEVIFTTNDITKKYKHTYSDIFDNYKKSFLQDPEYPFINFTNDDIRQETINLLKFYCEICGDHKEDFGSFQKLHEHLRSEHNKALCMICATHKNAFPSELTIFTPNQLRNHQSKGESDQGFKGHPMCAFCSGRRFYSDDELYLHMREKHEKCHICDKIDHNNPQYFKDYDQLFEHFKHYHYICTVPSCMEMKFVVFKDELELQAHILQEHGSIIKGKPKFFQSELSTFISAPSRVIIENSGNNNVSSLASLSSSSSSTGLNSNRNRRNDNTDVIVTPEVSQHRMEERAKYYLDNSDEGYQRFLKYNQEYDRGRLTSLNLLESYRNLFTTPQSDIYLLIRNFSETYPRNSNKYRELNSIYSSNEQRMERQNTNSNLPSLTDDRSFSVPIISGKWGNAGAVSSKSVINNLPSLPTSNHVDPFANPYNIRTSKPVRKSTTNLTATYGGNVGSGYNNRTSLSSNSVNFTQSFADSQRSDTSSSKSYTNNNNRSQDKLSQLNLPSLPTPKPRVVIPPVHKSIIPNPKSWGKNDPQPVQRNQNTFDDPNTLDLSGLTVKPARGGKGKKKGNQKQLLFHIGV